MVLARVAGAVMRDEMTKKQPETGSKGKQTRKTTRWLPVALTPKERSKAEKALAEASVKLAEAQAKLAKAKAELAEDLRSSRSSIQQITKALTVGKEAQVECEEEKDFDAKRIKIMRMDTLEIVEDRELHEWEMQADLEGEDVDGEEQDEE